MKAVSLRETLGSRAVGAGFRLGGKWASISQQVHCEDFKGVRLCPQYEGAQGSKGQTMARISKFLFPRQSSN